MVHMHTPPPPVVVTRPYVSYLLFQESEPAIAVGSRAHLQDEAVAQVRKLEFFSIRFYVELASPCTIFLKFCLLIFQ